MFEERNARKQFLNAPPSAPTAVAAVLEPLVAVACLAVLHLVYGQGFGDLSTALMILTLVLMFPGINRFGQTGVGVLIDIAMTWGGVVTMLLLVGYATRSLHQFSSDMLLAWAVLTPLTQWLCVTVGTRILLHRLRQPDMLRPAVIVGANGMGLRVAEVLSVHANRGFEFLGFFDDRSVDRVNLPEGSQLTGVLSDLPRFIDVNGVKDVYITLPLTSQPRILKLMEALQNTTASLHFVPDIFGVTIIQGRLEDMAGIPVVGLTVSPFTGLNGIIKRGSDLLLAALILLLVSPLMVAVAMGVKLSSPGPVLFRQRRTGLDGEIIEVFKFRSMTTLDNGHYVRQATRDDPRITRFGAFIRRTSLDELPQFFNVLRGDMSIVGPRPHAVAHNEAYRELVKAYMARHKVKPGVTGWAQVNGLRGETDTLDKMARRVEYDLEYLRNWSLGLDLLIIARTIKLVFVDDNAW
jgi:putative colanic acid biosysnthesis UDP-glucose lipid carrier transferase